MESTYTEGTLKIVLPAKIDSKNAADFEKELFAVKSLDAAKKILFDARNLNYISSMGLRVILKLLKKYKGVPVIFENASSEVYDVLETSGFTELMEVIKKMRRVDLNSLELLDAGMYGSVYRINDEQILKIFYNVNSILEIQHDIQTIRLAFTHGVPTVIPLEIVETEKGVGIIVELLNAKLLSSVIREDFVHFDKYVQEMVKLAKIISTTEFESGKLRNTNDMAKEYMDSAKNFLPPEEIAELKSYVDLVPLKNTCVHYDFHARNIMVMDGKLILIDMDDFGRGHPIWDLASTYRIYQHFAHLDYETEDKMFDISGKGVSQADFYFGLIGFTFDEADKLWEEFFNSYFEGYSAEDKADFLKLTEFYSLFMLIVVIIDWCHRLKEDPAQIAPRIEAIHKFLNEMRNFNLEKLRETFSKWGKGDKN